MTGAGGPAVRLFTVGHSNHTLARLLAILDPHGIELVLDVRALPRSRRHPQFSRGALEAALARVGLGYAHVPELGGLRGPAAGTARGAGWADAYRAHMATAEFARGIERVLAAAARRRAALLCAEADPAHCHRRFVADALGARGAAVLHLHPDGPATLHAPSAARDQGELDL